MTGHTGSKRASMREVRRCGAVAPERLYHSDVGDLYENESVQKHLQQLMDEYRELSGRLQHACLSESDRKVLVKKHTELLPVANVFKSVGEALRDLEDVLSLLHGEYYLLSLLAI